MRSLQALPPAASSLRPSCSGAAPPSPRGRGSCRVCFPGKTPVLFRRKGSTRRPQLRAGHATAHALSCPQQHARSGGPLIPTCKGLPLENARALCPRCSTAARHQVTAASHCQSPRVRHCGAARQAPLGPHTGAPRVTALRGQMPRQNESLTSCKTSKFLSDHSYMEVHDFPAFFWQNEIIPQLWSGPSLVCEKRQSLVF